jgi:hypothetical protein
MKLFALFWRPAAALLVVGLTSCGGDLTLPGGSAAGLGLELLRGNGQSGPVGQALPEPVVVRVATDAGTPMIGQRVAFAAQGGGAEGFSPGIAVTDSKGEALTHWVLGTSPGTYLGEARIVADGDTVVKSVSFQADATPGAPDTVRAVGPTTQPGHRFETLADSVKVMVVDRYGNPVGGAHVEWTPAGGSDGQVSEASALTGADGVSSVTWTLGGQVGVQRLDAKVDGASGSPVSFSAWVLF